MKNTPISCVFCGRPLEKLYLKTPLLFAEKSNDELFIGYKNCTCDKATAQREQERKAQHERDIQRAIEKRNRLYEKAGIAPFWWQKCAPDHSHTHTIKSGRGLYIYGAIGSGKTRLAVCVSMACIEAGMTVKITSMRDITRRLRGTFGGHLSEDDVFKQLMAPSVLVLDDLGKENMTESVLRDLFDVIDKRKDHMRPVIVTTNYTKPQLVERLANGSADTTTAESIVSRLVESTCAIHVEGTDRRLT